MGSGAGDELAVGAAVRPLLALVDSVRAEVARLDPGQLPARDAMDVVRVLDRVGRVADAGKMAAALRVADSGLWKRQGHRSGAHMVAKVTGVGVGDAVRLMKTGEAVAAAPETKDALAAGRVSPRQANALAKVEQVAPDKGRDLLAKAPDLAVGELEDEANRIVAAASTETDAERTERHRKARRVIDHGIGADGMGSGSWKLPPAAHARLVAQLTAAKEQIFTEHRRAGEHEDPAAYLADALVALGDRAANATTADRETPDGDGSEPLEDWGFAKVIVRVDATALDRGEMADGEVCEIAGQGPIPVADAWKIIDGDAFVAAIATRGTEITKLVHLGRRPTALQRTALEWLSAGECSVEGCTSKARLEIDHIADWADTHRTELGQIAGPCGHCHDLKTLHGYTFGPQLPNGKRPLLPPEGAATDHDARTGPEPPEEPAATAGPPDQPTEPTSITDAPTARTHPPGDAERRPDGPRQGDLFDTG